MIPINLADYLKTHGATHTGHSGATLWSHLTGVHRILTAVDAPEYVCTAGLFHSIYGTASFKKKTISKDKRPEVASLIGAKSEELVWHFCTLPRPRLFEVALKEGCLDWMDALTISFPKHEFWEDMLKIECANLLEQKNIHQFRFLVRHAREIGMLDREGFSV